MTGVSTEPAPRLPEPRGPVSAHVLARLRGDLPASTADPAAAGSATADPATADPATAELATAEPYGEDLQLALYCCYELHYRGFADVTSDLEWDPSLLGLRATMEGSFLRALRHEVSPGTDVEAELDALLQPNTGGLDDYLQRHGRVWQLREHVAARSLYHLKEADPQAFVLPRIGGRAKAALATITYDEYGAGDPERVHARLFAEMMRSLALCPSYGSYLDAAPAPALAEVNFMTLCGVHRALRGALIGQFAGVELTSSPGPARFVDAMRRLGCSETAIDFYAEHVEADAVHEQLIRREVIAGLLGDEPGLAADVVFGLRASGVLAGWLDDTLVQRWRAGRSGLRRALGCGGA